MATWAPAEQLAAPRSAPTRPRPVRKPAPRRRVTASVVWIVVLALVLAGIVALNVAVLRLNMQLDQLSRARAQLRAENATLASELSAAAASPQIVARAERLLHVAPASSLNTQFVGLASGSR